MSENNVISADIDAPQAHLVRLDLRKIAKNIRVADETLKKVETQCDEKMHSKTDDHWMTVSPNWLISVVHELQEYRKAAGVSVPSGREMIERYLGDGKWKDYPDTIC